MARPPRPRPGEAARASPRWRRSCGTRGKWGAGVIAPPRGAATWPQGGVLAPLPRPAQAPHSGPAAPVRRPEPLRSAPDAHRLWFVRMPRPPEAGAIKVVEQEVDTYRTQLSLITEALNVKKVRRWRRRARAGRSRGAWWAAAALGAALLGTLSPRDGAPPTPTPQVERDSAREATRAAREAFNLCRAAYDERAAPVKELQQERRAAADSSNKLKESFRCARGAGPCHAAACIDCSWCVGPAGAWWVLAGSPRRAGAVWVLPHTLLAGPVPPAPPPTTLRSHPRPRAQRPAGAQRGRAGGAAAGAGLPHLPRVHHPERGEEGAGHHQEAGAAARAGARRARLRPGRAVAGGAPSGAAERQDVPPRTCCAAPEPTPTPQPPTRPLPRSRSTRPAPPSLPTPRPSAASCRRR